MIIKPISNTVTLGSAKNVFEATAVYIVNTGSTVRTLTVANTVSIVNGGGDYHGSSQATVTLGKAAEGGSSIIIRKKPTDTINGGHAEVKATKIADANP